MMHKTLTQGKNKESNIATLSGRRCRIWVDLNQNLSSMLQDSFFCLKKITINPLLEVRPVLF